MTSIFQAQIRDLSSEGHGIASLPSGHTVFIMGAWPGETVRAKVSTWKKRIAFADLMEVIEPHEQRQTPFCPHQGVGPSYCGGCPWQFMDYAAQLNAKQQRVEQQLADFNSEVLPIIASPKITAYRNRTQLKTDGKQIGYVGHNSRQLVAIDSCPILTATNQQSLEKLIEQLPNPAWKAKRKQSWTTLDIDEENTEPHINQRLPFQQANSEQNQNMREWLRGILANNNANTLLELFCGSGNFTDILAEHSDRVIALDSDTTAVEKLQTKNLHGVEARVENLFAENVFTKMKKTEVSHLVLDPPRDGLKIKEGLLALCGDSLHQVIYISCNLATFKRDAQFFSAHGFVLSSVQPLDLAPHTPHLELLAVFSGV